MAQSSYSTPSYTYTPRPLTPPSYSPLSSTFARSKFSGRGWYSGGHSGGSSLLKHCSSKDTPTSFEYPNETGQLPQTGAANPHEVSKEPALELADKLEVPEKPQPVSTEPENRIADQEGPTCGATGSGRNENSDSLHLPTIYCQPLPGPEPELSLPRENDTPEQGKGARQTAKPRFACPYLKHDPAKYGQRRSCLGKFVNTSRVKEHLYRVHEQPLHCPRCGNTFKKKDALNKHLTRPEGVCQQVKDLTVEGFDADTSSKLKSKKRSAKTEVDKWRNIYRILFPRENNIPDPHYSDNHLRLGRGDIDSLLGQDISSDLEEEIESIFGPMEKEKLRKLHGAFKAHARRRACRPSKGKRAVGGGRALRQRGGTSSDEPAGGNPASPVGDPAEVSAPPGHGDILVNVRPFVMGQKGATTTEHWQAGTFQDSLDLGPSDFDNDLFSKDWLIGDGVELGGQGHGGMNGGRVSLVAQFSGNGITNGPYGVQHDFKGVSFDSSAFNLGNFGFESCQIPSSGNEAPSWPAESRRMQRRSEEVE